MPLIDDIVESYGRLELAVQKRMNAQCAAFCAVCSSPCCRIEFCRESMDSPFLAAVRERFSPAIQWDASAGWLTAGGCGLTAGRPPVCYEFLCRPILDTQNTDLQCEALKRLGMLLTIAGRRARGNRHLVEMTDLQKVNLSRLLSQLATAASSLTELG